jgi:hypothetical protein
LGGCRRERIKPIIVIAILYYIILYYIILYCIVEVESEAGAAASADTTSLHKEPSNVAGTHHEGRASPGLKAE